jgi:hypothetical protein
MHDTKSAKSFSGGKAGIVMRATLHDLASNTY